MADTGNSLSSAALAISLVALVISLLQALQQYFSTAEGYRQCQKDVMGAWSKLTRYHRDIRNLRYETRFITPNFVLKPPSEFSEPNGDQKFIDLGEGHVLPVGHPLIPQSLDKRGLTSARASWLALLERLESYQDAVLDNAFRALTSAEHDVEGAEKGRKVSIGRLEWYKHLKAENDLNECVSLPAITKNVVSWDFMPPDATKPFATATLHDLLVLGYRLGLDWDGVNPHDGTLHAQDGAGNDITAHRVNGIGLMASFQHDAGRTKLRGKPLPNPYPTSDLMVPTASADVLAFGVIPGDSILGFDNVNVATREDLLSFADTLDRSADDRREQTSRQRLQASFDVGIKNRSGLDHIMPLIAPCMVLPGCHTIKVRQPSEWCESGILDLVEGFTVFREGIRKWRTTDTTPEPRKTTCQWIHKRWRRQADNCHKPFIWTAFREQVPAPLLSAETSIVHAECTAELKKRADHLLYALDCAIRDHADQNYTPMQDRPTPDGTPEDAKDTRRPMQTLFELHMFRALALRERAAESDLTKVDTYGMQFKRAAMFFQMSKMQLDDLPDLSREFVLALLPEQYAGHVHKSAAFGDLVEHAENLWLVWIFRALVFNRSCQLTVPKRKAGGRPYNLLPAQWLHSQIPVHIT